MRAIRRQPITRLTSSRRRFVQGSLAVAVTVPALSKLARAQSKALNVYNWDTYIADDTIANFADAVGADVRYDLYAGNDELFAKLREGNPGYDVVFPSNDYVERMMQADLLIPLDHAKIPNMSNLEDRFLEASFDPGRQFSLTYFWGTGGLGYRKSVLEATSWGVVFGEESAEHAGRIALLRDSEIIQLCGKYLGFDANGMTLAQIDEIVAQLIKFKQNVKSYAGDNGQDLLISEEVDVCVEFNGDIAQVMTEDDDLDYVVPQEGSLIWEDAMCIPKGAPNVDTAHEFINYILEPEVHASIAEYVEYACPNKAAKELLPADMLENHVIYPPEEVLARCEFPAYQGIEIESAMQNGLTKVLAA